MTDMWEPTSHKFIEPCGVMEATDKCWLCGHPKARHAPELAESTISYMRFHGPDDKCEHGNRYSHQGGDRWPGMDSFDSANEMLKTCPGGRVPTRQELIDILGGELMDPLAQDACFYSHLIPSVAADD